jgi:long-chain acyl-CoA synthetase
MDAGGDQYHPLWDRVWSRKIRETLGGRLELIISGSAPLPKDTIRFLKAALAVEVIEGFIPMLLASYPFPCYFYFYFYCLCRVPISFQSSTCALTDCELLGYGMTETASTGCVGHPCDKVVGHVGPPVPHCEIVLEDVPSMNYTSNDKPYPRGELLLRGGMRLRVCTAQFFHRVFLAN